MKKRIHSASLKSNRLQKIIAVLRDLGKKGATTLELARFCNSTRPSSDVSECNHALKKARRKQHIPPPAYEGTSANGRRIFRYHLSTASV